MKKSIITFILTVISLQVMPQSEDLVRKYNEVPRKRVFSSRIYTVTNRKENVTPENSITYESQGEYHSTYLTLNPDSTYVYYSVFEVGYSLATGKWTEVNDTILFNWNKQKTTDIIKNKEEYEKYYKYSTPRAVPMNNWMVVKADDKLIPVKDN
jgi:hypothetical protein